MGKRTEKLRAAAGAAVIMLGAALAASCDYYVCEQPATIPQTSLLGPYSGTGVTLYRNGATPEDGKWRDGDVAVLHEAAVAEPYVVILVPEAYGADELSVGGLYERRARKVSEIIFAQEPMNHLRDRVEVRMLCMASESSGLGTGSTLLGADFFKEDRCTGIKYDMKTLKQLGSLAVRDRGDIRDRSCVFALVNHEDASVGSTVLEHLKAGAPDIQASGAMTAGDGPDDDAMLFRTATHEIVGHAIGVLADEYVYDDPMDVCELPEIIRDGSMKNIAFDTFSASWLKYIGLDGYEDVGLYEGASYCMTGVWKSEPRSIMGGSSVTEGLNFNAISRELIYRRLTELTGGTYDWDTFLEFDRKYYLNNN